MSRRNWLQRTLGSIGAAFTAPAIAAIADDLPSAQAYPDSIRNKTTESSHTPNAFYTPDPDATAHLSMHTSDQTKYPINQYADMVFDPVTANGRIPGLKRYCFPFEVRWQKHPAGTAECAAIPAANAMLVRTWNAASRVQLRNWGDRRVNFNEPRFWDLLRTLKDRGLYRFVMNAETHKKVVRPINSTTDGCLWPGVCAVIEDNKIETHMGDPAKMIVRSTWPDGMILLAYCPKTEAERRKSTIRFKFAERMTVETKPDRDNNRYVGRVVEDYAIEINPEFGFLVMGA
jgi:hypothetical protein